MKKKAGEVIQNELRKKTKSAVIKKTVGIIAVILVLNAVAVAVIFGLKTIKEKYSKNQQEITTSSPSTSETSMEVSKDVHEIYETFLKTAEAEKYFEVSPAFRDYYADDGEYESYVKTIYAKDKSVSYFDLDLDGTDECVLSVCFYADALDHYVFYIFDVDGEKVRCVDSAEELYGAHRSLNRLQIYQDEGEFYIRKYIHDPHLRYGSVYRYNGEKLVLVESLFMIEEAYDEWIRLYSNKYDLYNEKAANYLDCYEKNYSEFVPEYGLKELTDEEYYKIIDNYDKKEVYSLYGDETALWESFSNSGYFSETFDTYGECRDFNGDGKREMFVLKFKEEYGEEGSGDIYPAALYLVTQEGIKVVEEEVIATPGAQTNAYYIGGRWFFSFVQRFSGGNDEYLYTVVGENAVNVSVGGGGACIVPDMNEVSLCFVEYDRFIVGAGRTNIDYYFYWDENSTSFKEYGAIEIEKKDFLKCDGAKELLEKIENKGYTIIGILYRENGIININCENGEEYLHYTCRITDNKKIELVGDFEYSETPGPCKNAAVYNIATYPDNFPY